MSREHNVNNSEMPSITKYLKFLAATCNGQAHSRGEEKSFLLFVKNITKYRVGSRWNILVLLIFKNFLVEIRFPFILYLLQNLVSLYLSLTKICESSETTNYISIKHNWRIFNKTSLADLYTILQGLK